ncbi:hypothetical protein ACS0TY_013276 [Phlomoides rotata]
MVNVDATFFHKSMQMGIGVVVHDENGDFVCEKSILLSSLFRVDEGEAIGVLEALSWVKSFGNENVLLLRATEMV